MTAYQMVVRLNAAPGRDAEFNAWYDSEHVGHVLSVPGFVASKRYRIAQAHGGRRFAYCTVFDIDTDAIGAVMADLQARAADGRLPLSAALDPEVEFEVLQAMAAPSTGPDR